MDNRRIGIDAYLTTSKRSMQQGSTEHSKLVLGVEAEVWTIAAKMAGKWYHGVLEAAERFMANWHENGDIEQESPRIRYGRCPRESDRGG